MKKTLKITLLVIIYLFAFTSTVQAFTANFNGTPTSVNSEGTFTVKVTVDEAAGSANAHIKYDSSLFEFKGATQTNLTAAIFNNDGEISWKYLDTSSNVKGTKTFEFTFKAKKVSADKTGIFQITDAKFVTVGNRTYEGNNIKGDKEVAVTVKAGSNLSASVLSSGGSTTTKASTTSYNNNGITNKTSLPKTGASEVTNYVLLAGTVVMVLALVFKVKSRKEF